MEKDNTAVAPAEPIGRRCRMVGVGLGVSYLLMPTVMLNLRLSNVLWALLNACCIPAGLLALGFLAASLWRAPGRDWRAADRAFGIFLVTAAALMIGARVSSSWTSSAPFYTEATQRLMFARWLLGLLLVLSGAGLLFTRYSLASIPLGLLAALMLLSHFSPIKPDHPDYLKRREQAARMEPFDQAVDDTFWEAYSFTRDPEAVAALVGGLPPEARAALSDVLGEEAVQALLERGDDRVFLQIFRPGIRRDEDGGFVGASPALRPGIRVIAPGNRLLFLVVLAYALTRSVMARRS